MNYVANNRSLSRKREQLAQAGTVLFGLAILIVTQTVVMSQDEPTASKPVTITLLDPPPVPKIEPPKPVITPPKPVKTVQPPKIQTPVIARPSPAPSPVEVPVEPVKPAPQKSVTPMPVAPPVPRVSNGVAEGEFAQDVRKRIERKKIYPDTARDLGMSGEVEVLYELDRDGKLIRAEIASSSGFKLLDQAALAAVKSASYKAFPEDAWIGAKTQVFRTKLVFSLNQ